MTYEGKFRDFMVGWLDQQPDEPATPRAELRRIYETLISAETDAEALDEMTVILGRWGAQLLWRLSQQWYDAPVEMARDLIDDLRHRSQEDTGNGSDFYRFYLNPFKADCVPDGDEVDVEGTICWMLRTFYLSAGASALTAWGRELYVVVEPSNEAASNIIVLDYPRDDPYSKQFVLQHWRAAWLFRFANLSELAEELLLVRQAITDPSPMEFIS